MSMQRSFLRVQSLEARDCMSANPLAVAATAPIAIVAHAPPSDIVAHIPPSEIVAHSPPSEVVAHTPPVDHAPPSDHTPPVDHDATGGLIDPNLFSWGGGLVNPGVAVGALHPNHNQTFVREV